MKHFILTHWSQSADNLRCPLHTGLWHFKCPMFGLVCSSFGPALPPSPCLLLLRWLFLLLPTLCRLLRPLSPPCILPSALPAAAGLSSGLSCCWCFLNKMWALIQARSRMSQKTPLTIFRTAFDGVSPRIWSVTSTQCWCYSTSETLVLPSPCNARQYNIAHKHNKTTSIIKICSI